MRTLYSQYINDALRNITRAREILRAEYEEWDKEWATDQLDLAVEHLIQVRDIFPEQKGEST